MLRYFQVIVHSPTPLNKTHTKNYKKKEPNKQTNKNRINKTKIKIKNYLFLIKQYKVCKWPLILSSKSWRLSINRTKSDKNLLLKFKTIITPKRGKSFFSTIVYSVNSFHYTSKYVLETLKKCHYLVIIPSYYN